MLAAVLPSCDKLHGLLLDDAGRGPDLSDPAADGADGTDGSGVAVFGVQVCEALCVLGRSCTGGFPLTQLGLGSSPAVRPVALVSALDALLRAAPRLTTLHLAGGPSLRLKGELPHLLGLIARGAASGGAPLTSLDVSGHHAGDSLLEAAPPLLSGQHALHTLLLHNNQLSISGLEQLAHLIAKVPGLPLPCRPCPDPRSFA